jgi:hypothetical protein
MSEMRTWLDAHRYESSSFSCRDEDFDVVVSVGFTIGRQAEAFAHRFAARADGALGDDAEEELSRGMLTAIDAASP